MYTSKLMENKTWLLDLFYKNRACQSDNKSSNTPKCQVLEKSKDDDRSL